MKIKIENKYLYILDDSDKQIAYFEHFETKKENKIVIALSVEDKVGRKFIKQNNYKISEADVYWFSPKKLRYKVMFVEQEHGSFQYMVLIVPKLLKFTS